MALQSMSDMAATEYESWRIAMIPRQSTDSSISISPAADTRGCHSNLQHNICLDSDFNFQLLPRTKPQD